MRCYEETGSDSLSVETIIRVRVIAIEWKMQSENKEIYSSISIDRVCVFFIHHEVHNLFNSTRAGLGQEMF